MIRAAARTAVIAAIGRSNWNPRIGLCLSEELSAQAALFELDGTGFRIVAIICARSFIRPRSTGGWIDQLPRQLPPGPAIVLGKLPTVGQPGLSSFGPFCTCTVNDESGGESTAS